MFANFRMNNIRYDFVFVSFPINKHDSRLCRKVSRSAFDILLSRSVNDSRYNRQKECSTNLDAFILGNGQKNQ